MSAKDRSELEPLFTPPPGEYGTNLLLCGLSADAETLERALAAFTNEAPAQRRASGLVRGWLLLDASTPITVAQPAPGLLQFAPCVKEEWRARTTLLHAKVALMGFGMSRCGVPRRWRLVVSTGNWTVETWGRDAQIDMFWTTEWDTQVDLAGETAQSLADVHAAFSFFERILEGLHGLHYDMLRDEPLAAGWLKPWREQLRLRGRARKCKPRFVHSLERPLLQQIDQHFPTEGVSTLVAGSGFFEQGNDTIDETPAVLQHLEKLGRPGMTRYLVFNPSSAGALAAWLTQLRGQPRERRKLESSQAGKWTLCVPRDPLQKSARAGRTFLHAKYIAGLHAVREKGETARLAFLYLGSGNLSRRGVLSRARLDAQVDVRHRNVGNIEAGVMLLPDERVERIWQRLACGDCATPAAIAAAVPGVGGELFEPRDPPPLLFLREGAGVLHLARSALAAGPLWLQEARGVWKHIAAGASTVEWSSACPPSVRARAADPATLAVAPEWEVPVLSRDGLFCRRTMPRLTMDSVLQALLAFPSVPPHDDDDDDDGTNRGRNENGRKGAAASPYPLRTLAALVETIAQRNALVTEEEFPYWLTQLRLLLLEQAAEAERSVIRDLGVDLFDALERPGFIPPWLAEHPQLQVQYEDLLQDLRAAWCLPQPGHQ